MKVSALLITHMLERVNVPNKVKYMNVKVVNLMSEVNETKFLVEYESCECMCRLNKTICKSRQKWKQDKCWCECKELDDWGSYENNFMGNPSSCDCECNKEFKLLKTYLVKNI